MSEIRKFNVNGTDASIGLAGDNKPGFVTAEEREFIQGIKGDGSSEAGIDSSIIKYNTQATADSSNFFTNEVLESGGWTSGKTVTVQDAVSALAKQQTEMETSFIELQNYVNSIPVIHFHDTEEEYEALSDEEKMDGIHLTLDE